MLCKTQGFKGSSTLVFKCYFMDFSRTNVRRNLGENKGKMTEFAKITLFKNKSKAYATYLLAVSPSPHTKIPSIRFMALRANWPLCSTW